MAKLYQGCYQWHTCLLGIKIHLTLDLARWGVGIEVGDLQYIRFHILCFEVNFARRKRWEQKIPF